MSARCTCLLGCNSPWQSPKDCPYHSYRPSEDGPETALSATESAEQPSAQGVDGSGPETGSEGATDERTREDAGVNVERHDIVVPVSDEVLADARAFQASVTRWQQATPEEREAWGKELKRERAEQRAAADRRELTLEALLEKLGYERAFAEHLVQPYCECWPDDGGWVRCAHAYDEGLAA